MRTPPWKTIRAETVAKFKFLALRRTRMRRERDGREDDFVVLDLPDWVMALADDGNGSVLLARQYRFGTAADSWEPPGGIVEKGESAADAAARELLEETGYAAPQTRDLGWCYVNPPLQGNRAFFVWLRGCKKIAEPKLDPNEDIEVKWFPIPEALAMARDGGIRHLGAVAALLKLADALRL